MDDDTKQHFQLLHEALGKTNDALEDLRGHVQDAGGPIHGKISSAKDALEKAKGDLKKHL
jgi:uncharacterized protein YjbJ (UPF0337 family)